MSRQGAGMVEFDDCEVLAETEKALLVYISAIVEEVWIPKSQVDTDDSEIREKGDVGMLVMTRWFAEKEGWV